jgi:D-3-phosphoglycerate dehydrogenase / 2-oxoglutarate reductase
MAIEAFRLLIVDDVHPILMDQLSHWSDLEIDYRPELSPSEIPTTLQGYNGLVIRTKCRITAEMMAASPHLRFIARAGAGLDNLDEAAAQQLGIRLLNAPEGNRQAVAEHVAGMLLTLFNKLRQADAQVRQGIWDREGNRGHELMGKTVGLIGFGHNGSATAKILKGFGCDVLAYDKYKSGFSNEFVKEVVLEQLFEQADILSLHLPLTKESAGMVNQNFLNAFHKPIYLVNIARGELLSLNALNEALKSGQVLGVCLDVLEIEKPNEWSNKVMADLFAHPNALFSPHIAGWSVESYRKISIVLAEKINHYFADVLLKGRH